MRHRLLAALISVLALLAVGLPAAAEPPATPPGKLPDLDQIDPVRFAYEDAIVEHALVTTRNGIDQIWVDIIRPDTDEPVPAIMMSSPYYNTLGRGWKGEVKTPHQGPSNPFAPATRALGGGSVETPFPEWYDEYFVPRGYAYVAMDLRGTRNSSGCQTYGDRDEVIDTVDVIDWIADQEWSNGKVGMTGGSYDGTIAIGAAAEQPMSGRHPDALAAIIPIRSIDRWYDYHFFNGVQSSSHQATPALFTAALAGMDTNNSGTDDVLFGPRVVERKACIGTLGALAAAGYASPYQDARDAFWRERDFQRSARGFRAATFLISGLFDYNVKTNNVGYLWESLDDDLPKKLWLMNSDHADPHIPDRQSAGSKVMPFPFQAKFVDATHRWFLQYLKGVEAGAAETPQFEAQNGDGSWSTGELYPAATADRVLSLSADGTAVDSGAESGVVTYKDGPSSSAPSRQLFVTEPFQKATRLSGQIAFDWDMAATGRDATVAVEVVSVPEDVDPLAGTTIVHDGADAKPLVISYGWLRGYYRDSVPLRGVSTPTAGSFLTPGETFDATFGGLYTDYIIPAGHRLAFKVSSNAGGTVASNAGGTVSLLTGDGVSTIRLPIVD